MVIVLPLLLIFFLLHILAFLHYSVPTSAAESAASGAVHLLVESKKHRQNVRRRTWRRIHHGWTACRPPNFEGTSNNVSEKEVRQNIYEHDIITVTTTSSREIDNFVRNGGCSSRGIQTYIVPKIPTTALMVLLENKQIKIVNEQKNNKNKEEEEGKMSDVTPENLYYSTNLDKIPDISKVGREFYTLLYEYNLTQLITDPIIHNEDYDDDDDDKNNNNNKNKDHHLWKLLSKANIIRTNTMNILRRKTLRLSGINYYSKVYIDGEEVKELSGNSDTVGMFHRKSYDIGFNHAQRLSILIRPPFHPGTCHNVTSTKQVMNSNNDHIRSTTEAVATTACTGQGGNHELAKDGPIAQYMVGWDWCQSIPDRSTGFYGSVVIETTPGPFVLRDPTIQTVSLQNCTRTGTGTPSSKTTATSVASDDTHDDSDERKQRQRQRRIVCNDVHIRIMVRLECFFGTTLSSNTMRDSFFGNDGKNGTRIVVRVASDWDESWEIPVWIKTPLSAKNSSNNFAFFEDIQKVFVVKNATMVHLWWAHGLGVHEVAYLHAFTFSIHIDSIDTANAFVSDETTIRTGIRTIETYIDKNKTNGQVFVLNGYKLYIVGGNWIGTDQALRYSASKRRYCNEIRLHKHAGINLLRIWGGGVAETDDFYECADEIGILIYQEFWMTGDNNGRWNGNYSWPLDKTSYLHNVNDTIRRLRYHPSLLFYGGCNECLAPRDSPWFPNPSADINSAIQNSIESIDPGRFYIPSSMGGYNKADSFYDPTLWDNRSYSLSYMDGPYGMLLPYQFFERNPGLPFKNISIGFQPEIGSASAPTYEGLLRFMTEDEADLGFPKKNGQESVGKAWDFHRYQSWASSDTPGYDHVYAYFDDSYSVNSSEWCAAAQLAAHEQYHNLFNGFISHTYDYTTAVILWKSQSPWPSLRGFLYDWFLETTGSLRGVKAALENPVSVVLDRKLSRFRLVNRQIFPIIPLESNGESSYLGAEYAWINLNGTVLSMDKIFLETGLTVPSMSAVVLGGGQSILNWPDECSNVCILRIKIIGSNDFHSIISPSRAPTWHWLTNPALGHESNYSELGQMRVRQAAIVHLIVNRCYSNRHRMLVLDVQIKVASNSPELLFYPAFTLSSRGGKPILPLFDENETNIVTLPGQTESRTLQSTNRLSLAFRHLDVTLSSWNSYSITKSCFVHDLKYDSYRLEKV